MSTTRKGLALMSRILSKFFPLFDYLYIYQILEYNSLDFLKWFLKNPLKRNLQKKHKLEWTQKAKLLALVSLVLIFLDSVITSYKLNGGFWLFLILLPFKFLYSPLFLIASQFLIWPLESYQKQSFLNTAGEKLSKLPDLKVVAITGSFGKTSTKDILYTLLFKKYYAVKTPKSFNTPQGIAQIVLEMVKINSDIFICEMGAYKIGEIKKICDFIKPDIGIITAIAPQHLERFRSLENIAKAKFELIQSLPTDGTAILNGNYESIKNNASAVSTKIIFYGSENDPFYATDIESGIEGTTFILHTPKGETNIKIPLIGKHHVQNFLAATAAAMQLGLTLFEIKERAKLLLPTPHRMEIKKIGNIIFIDNSYNTNPKSAENSLNLLNGFKDARKIVITPGFVELGKEASNENQKFGNNIACIADEIIIVGENAKKDLLDGIKQVWPDAEQTTHFVNSTQEGIALAQQLAKELIQRIARDDTQVVVLLENDLPDQYS